MSPGCGEKGVVEMKIGSFLKWGTLCIAVVVYKNAEAREVVKGVDEVSQIEPASNHLSYLELLTSLNERVDTGTAIRDIQTHMKFSTQQSEVFLDYVVESYQAIEASNRSLSDELLCYGRKVENKHQLQNLLEVAGDIKETNLKKYYHRALVTIGEQHAEDLVDWLSAIKSSQIRSGIERYQSQRSVSDLNEMVNSACQNLATL